MEALVDLGVSLLGPEPGVTLFMFIALGLSLWAYWKEKGKNETVANERLNRAREDTELFMAALNEANNTIREFKASNDALRRAFEVLSHSMSHKDGG